MPLPVSIAALPDFKEVVGLYRNSTNAINSIYKLDSITGRPAYLST
jgi:hypothetical protein